MTTTEPVATGHAPIRDDKGYYHTPYGDFLSVTTLIEGGVPKPGLVHWAAIEVARCAIEVIPRLSRLRGEAAREEAYQWLRRAAERKRDTAADLGSAIHDHVESRILGAATPEPTPEQRPFIEAFDRFLDDHQPVFEATEMVVANPDDRWAGKLDTILSLPAYGPALLTGDWKTGKSTYDEMALQLSAYRRPKVAWLRDGTEITPPATEGGVVVHIRPDKYPDRGGYRLYQVDTSDQVYDSFLSARDVALGWTKRPRKRAVTVWDLAPIAKQQAA